MNCRVCGDAGKKEFTAKTCLLRKNEHQLLKCPSCGAFYFDPLPSVEELDSFYAPSYYGFDREREVGKGMAFAGRLKKEKRKGRLLDVGCATGFFLKGIKDNSEWEVYGTDYSKEAVGFAAEKLGLDVRAGELDEAGFETGFFDYIHVNNVLEHVLDPLKFMKECRRIIRPGGKMMLSVPNGCADSRDLIELYNIKGIPAKSVNGHIFFFSKKAITGLIERTGFKIEKANSYGLKRGLRSFGLIPKKKGWEAQYFAEETQGKAKTGPIEIEDKPRKHTGLYYRVKYFTDKFKMYPGLSGYALDYLFILKAD